LDRRIQTDPQPPCRGHSAYRPEAIS
jgi:hypothetical protein